MTKTRSNDRERLAAAPASLVKKLCMILVAVSCMVYINTLANGYVMDDDMMLADNAYVKEGFSGIPALLTTPHLKGYMNGLTDTYRPLSLVMFAAEYQFFGPNPVATHFFTILTFAGAVLMLFLFVYRLTREKRPALAFMTALLFAVHPIHTEAVANIKSRDEVLCFLLAFLSLNIFISYARSGKPAQLLLGTLCLFLAIISKETAATLILVVPLIFFFFETGHKKRAMLITGATILVTASFIAIRAFIIEKYRAEGMIEFGIFDNQLVAAPDFATRTATAILILGNYLKLAFVPYRLLCDYSYCTIPLVGFGNPWVLISAVVHVGLAGGALYLLFTRKRNLWAFGILYYLATISIFSNIGFIVGATQADRFLFFASAGSCLLLALAIEKWVLHDESIAALKTRKAWVLFSICIVFSVMTIARNENWKDDYTLYKTDVEKMPNNARLYTFVGMELQKQSELEDDPVKKEALNKECITNLQKAIAIYPPYSNAHAELGTAFLIQGNSDSAIVHLKRAIELDPRRPQAISNLATLYLIKEEFGTAAPYFHQSVVLEPGDFVAWFNLAICYSHVAKYDSAVYGFKKVIALNPSFNNYMAFANLAAVYNNMHLPDSAMKYGQIARQYVPQTR